ncbi:hypothetical protein DY467_25375 [Rhodopseudomonas sp. BR0G17]|nr:hypothetical protein [Rhodopseudomonas sp. BR0G17]
MPTLNIEGRRIRVDDSFLSLSPDQQNDAVDEIATSLRGSGHLPAPLSSPRPVTSSTGSVAV